MEVNNPENESSRALFIAMLLYTHIFTLGSFIVTGLCTTEEDMVDGYFVGWIVTLVLSIVCAICISILLRIPDGGKQVAFSILSGILAVTVWSTILGLYSCSILEDLGRLGVRVAFVTKGVGVGWGWYWAGYLLEWRRNWCNDCSGIEEEYLRLANDSAGYSAY